MGVPTPRLSGSMETSARGRPHLSVDHAIRRSAPANGRRASRPNLFLWIGIGYAAHVPLALLMSRQPIVGAVHAVVSLILGLGWAISGRRPVRVAYVAAYVTGAEVFWRMTGAPLYWEFAKYAVALFFLVGTLRLGWPRRSLIAIVYFALLLPSAVLTVTEKPLPLAVDDLSFNLSGPFALMASVLFFSRLRLSFGQLQRLLLVGIAPFCGVGAIVVQKIREAPGIGFGTSSNVATSGGFGPNQVSAVLGFAIVLLALVLVTGQHGAFLDVGLLALLFVFAIQSAMTFSRGGLYMAGLSLVVASVPMLRERRFRRRLIVGLGVVALVAIVVVVPRLASYTEGAILVRFSETTTTGRTEIVRADLETWSEHPILGVGPGQGRAFRARFFRPAASHTEYSRLLAEHGLFGIAALICLLVLVRSALRRSATPAVQAARCALLAWSLLFMLVDGMRLAAPVFAFGLPFAEVLARPHSQRQEAPGADEEAGLRAHG